MWPVREHLGVEMDHRPPWYQPTVARSVKEVPGWPASQGELPGGGGFPAKIWRGKRDKVEDRESL